MTYWRNQDFKTLQKQWYQRLEDLGFEDAEVVVGDETFLRQTSERPFRACPVRIKQKEDYYRVLTHRVADSEFRNEVDQQILTLRSEGKTFKEIAVAAKCERKKVRFTIRKYEMAWGLRRYTLQQLDLDVKVHPSSYTIISFPGSDLSQTYRNLIYSKWLRSLRFSNDYFKLTDSDSYYQAYTAYVTTILSKKDCVVRLAVLTDDRDVVLGFSVSRTPVLDYVHVHKDNRRLGIATKLVPDGIKSFTHVTTIGLSIWGSKYPHLKFNPFA